MQSIIETTADFFQALLGKHTTEAVIKSGAAIADVDGARSKSSSKYFTTNIYSFKIIEINIKKYIYLESSNLF